MRLYIVIILTSILFACNENSNVHVVTKDVMSAFTADSSSVYFPIDTTEGVTGILEDWANKVLLSLNEPGLKNYTGTGDFIRLTWLRAFENPIVIRSNKFGDTSYVTLKENSFSFNGPENPRPIKDTIINISTKEWSRFTEQIDKSDYWNSPYNDSIIGKDGVTWFLECRIEGKYKVIRRWDDGYLSSRDLNKYLSNFIQEMNKYTRLKSAR